MSQFGVRSIYNQEELERLSQAPGKLAGMFDPKRRAAASEKLDSGFDEGSLGSMGDEPPPPPKLLGADTEQQDSGLGREADSESEDELEKDHITVETRAPTAVTGTSVGSSSKGLVRGGRSGEKPAPRRPRKTIAPSRNQMTYTTPVQPTAPTTSSAHGGPGLPSQAQEEVQRMRLQDQWRLFQFQRQLNYLLPNRDGDT